MIANAIFFSFAPLLFLTFPLGKNWKNQLLVRFTMGMIILILYIILSFIVPLFGWVIDDLLDQAALISIICVILFYLLVQTVKAEKRGSQNKVILWLNNWDKVQKSVDEKEGEILDMKDRGFKDVIGQTLQEACRINPKFDDVYDLLSMKVILYEVRHQREIANVQTCPLHFFLKEQRLASTLAYYFIVDYDRISKDTIKLYLDSCGESFDTIIGASLINAFLSNPKYDRYLSLADLDCKIDTVLKGEVSSISGIRLGTLLMNYPDIWDSKVVSYEFIGDTIKITVDI